MRAFSFRPRRNLVANTWWFNYMPRSIRLQGSSVTVTQALSLLAQLLILCGFYKVHIRSCHLKPFPGITREKKCTQLLGVPGSFLPVAPLVFTFCGSPHCLQSPVLKLLITPISSQGLMKTHHGCHAWNLVLLCPYIFNIIESTTLLVWVKFCVSMCQENMMAIRATASRFSPSFMSEFTGHGNILNNLNHRGKDLEERKYQRFIQNPPAKSCKDGRVFFILVWFGLVFKSRNPLNSTQIFGFQKASGLKKGIALKFDILYQMRTIFI